MSYLGTILYMNIYDVIWIDLYSLLHKHLFHDIPRSWLLADLLEVEINGTHREGNIIINYVNIPKLHSFAQLYHNLRFLHAFFCSKFKLLTMVLSLHQGCQKKTSINTKVHLRTCFWRRFLVKKKISNPTAPTFHTTIPNIINITGYWWYSWCINFSDIGEIMNK